MNYEPPSEPLREEAERLAEELGVEWAYPGSGGSSTNPDAPLNPFAAEGGTPMREWKPFIPQALVHAEADRIAAAAKALTDDMSWKKGMTDRQITMIYDLIAGVDRLVPRYKELWDIASGIVNSENLKEDS